MLRHIFIIKFTLLLLIVTLPVSAQYSEDDRSNKIKAAFALNLARFIIWPIDATAESDQMTLCLFENKFLGLATDSIVGQEIAGQTLAVNYRLDVETVKSCQIIFITGEKFSKFTERYPNIAQQPTLIIVDNTAFNEFSIESSLAMVSLNRKGGSIVFDINLLQVEAAKLKMSSKLLKLARNVYTDDR